MTRSGYHSVNEREVDLVSKRLHNYEFQPRVGASSPTKAGSDYPDRGHHPVARQIDPFGVIGMLTHRADITD